MMTQTPIAKQWVCSRRITGWNSVGGVRPARMAVLAVAMGATAFLPSGAQAAVAFQSNVHTIRMHPGGQSASDTGVAVPDGSSPSVATLSTGGTVTALRSKAGRLVIRISTTGALVDTGVTVRTGTSPTIAADRIGGFMAAAQADNSELTTYSSATGVNNTHQGLLVDTSPSIAALSNSSYKIAFQSNIGQLILINGNGDPASLVNTQYGLRGHTSPSIAAAPTGAGYSVAFQANTGVMWSYSPTSGGFNTNQGMMAGTNPAIAYASGSYWVAFQSNVGQLTVIKANGDASSVTNPKFGMASWSSPAIAPARGAAVQVAFQSNANQLWTWTTGTSGNNTLQPMDGRSSPSIAYDYPSTWWFGGSNVRLDELSEKVFLFIKIKTPPEPVVAKNPLDLIDPAERPDITSLFDSFFPSSRLYGGSDWNVDTAAEAAMVISAVRSMTDDAAGPAFAAMLSQTERDYVRARVTPGSLAYGGANWWVDTPSERDAVANEYNAAALAPQRQGVLLAGLNEGERRYVAGVLFENSPYVRTITYSCPAQDDYCYPVRGLDYPWPPVVAGPTSVECWVSWRILTHDQELAIAWPGGPAPTPSGFILTGETASDLLKAAGTNIAYNAGRPTVESALYGAGDLNYVTVRFEFPGPVHACHF